MSLLTVCFLGIGLWAIITFFVISALVVAGKADEKLGYKTPLEELLPESDRFDNAPSIPRQPLYDPGKSEGFST